MHTFFKSLALFFSLTFFINNAFAQSLLIPYEIANASEFTDAEIYVALVGKINDKDVWVDLSTNTVNEMKLSDNTLQGPIYNDNTGPGGNAMYANCFTLLSNVPDKIIDIPHIKAARLYISFESPLYLYFSGTNEEGIGGGYSTPSLANESDPNLGLKFETIELTYNETGLRANTTRVDAYQYPMGLEVWGTNGFYKRIGEVLSHDDILNQWRTTVSTPFQPSLDEENEIILSPANSLNFQEGETYNNYFSDYVDAVWTHYENQEIRLSLGETDVWLGQVNDEAQFVFTNQTDATVATISAKPTTLEIFNGNGVLAEAVDSSSSIDANKNIQKQFSAAFNRGAINLETSAETLIEWSDLTRYFTENTHNEYAAFWHSNTISYQGDAYAFNYDDIFNSASIIQTDVPEKVKITIGGFVNDEYVAPQAIEITSIIGSHNSSAFIITLGVGTEVGLNSEDIVQFEANILPLNVHNPAVLWHSSDTSIATVSDGMITGVNTGTATITLSSYDNSVSETILVEVNGINDSDDVFSDSASGACTMPDSATISNINIQPYVAGCDNSVDSIVSDGSIGLTVSNDGTDTFVITSLINKWSVPNGIITDDASGGCTMQDSATISNFDIQPYVVGCDNSVDLIFSSDGFVDSIVSGGGTDSLIITNPVMDFNLIQSTVNLADGVIEKEVVVEALNESDVDVENQITSSEVPVIIAIEAKTVEDTETIEQDSVDINNDDTDELITESPDNTDTDNVNNVDSDIALKEDSGTNGGSVGLFIFGLLIMRLCRSKE